MNQPFKKRSLELFSAIFSGMGLGLLVGALMGLSNSPVVATVVSSLVALLAAYFGLLPKNKEAQTEGQKTPTNSHMNDIKIGSFSFFVIIGMVGGLFMRTHDTLSVSPKDQFLELKNVGYTDEVALKIIAKNTYNYTSQDSNYRNQSLEKMADMSSKTLLFDTETQEICRSLAKTRFSNTNYRLDAFKNRGPALKSFADTIRLHVHEQHQDIVLDAFLAYLSSTSKKDDE